MKITNSKHWKNFNKIFEGEILTHDIDKSVSILTSLLKDKAIVYKQKRSEKTNSIINVFSYIFIEIKENLNINELNNMIKYINNLGYFISNIEYDTKIVSYSDNNIFDSLKDYFKDSKNDKCKIILESKYDVQYIPDVINLYHICTLENLNSILKLGLLTKSKNKKSFHPERIYLSKNINVSQLSKDFKELAKINWLNYKNKEKHNNPPSFEYCLLKIDIRSMLNDNVNIIFYEDPNHYDACYTYNSINPKYIEYLFNI